MKKRAPASHWSPPFLPCYRYSLLPTDDGLPSAVSLSETQGRSSCRLHRLIPLSPRAGSVDVRPPCHSTLSVGSCPIRATSSTPPECSAAPGIPSLRWRAFLKASDSFRRCQRCPYSLQLPA